jgi:hypothetical protein
VVVTEPGSPAYLRVDRLESTLTFENPGSPVVTSAGASSPIVWVIDENAPRTASLLDPATPHPILYAIDGTTMTVLWTSALHAGDGLHMGGKYSTVTTANGVVLVGTDRVQAFGIRAM